MIVFGIILLLIAVMNPELAALWGVGIIAHVRRLGPRRVRRGRAAASATGATTTDGAAASSDVDDAHDEQEQERDGGGQQQ